MNTEHKVEEIEVYELDLENLEDRNKLEAETQGNNSYWKPENDVTYKVLLTSSKIVPVEKTFEDKTLTKYQMKIKAENSKKQVFEGIWEVGSKVMQSIVKGYEPTAVFKITKSGSGLDTRYNIIKDF
jgi:hypothetical protein